MAKFICMVCGYINESGSLPTSCPQCSAAASKFKEMSPDSMALPDEHRIGIAEGIDNDIADTLRQNYESECFAVGMYMAMSRQADRDGLPEVSAVLSKIAAEKSLNSAKYAEVLGEALSESTRKNIQFCCDLEYNSCDARKRLATKTKQLNLDALHDVVHEMCKDDARHCSMLRGVLGRYF